MVVYNVRKRRVPLKAVLFHIMPQICRFGTSNVEPKVEFPSIHRLRSLLLACMKYELFGANLIGMHTYGMH
jgi:hypothetical protein